MSGNVTGFAKFPNMRLLQEEASVVTSIEQQETPSYTSDSLAEAPNRNGPIHQVFLRIMDLDLEITRLSTLQSCPDIAMRIEQLKLQRSDHQEVMLQNVQPSKELLRLDKFVDDLWNSFKPENKITRDPPDVPLVKWASGSSAKKGPYTWSMQDVQIISMPKRYAEKGILGWTALAHEVGHDLLEGRGGLIQSLRLYLQWKMPAGTVTEQVLKTYFLSRISEIGADIMGVLILGPASGLGCIAYLRSQRNSFLSCTDMSPHGAHPVDISRAYLVAYAMNVLLPNRKSQEVGPGMPIQKWNEYCEEMMQEMLKDLSQTGGCVTISLVQGQTLQIHCNEVAAYCRQTVDILIECLRKTVQLDQWKWNEKDEGMVEQLIGKASITPLDSRHIVAAAFFESLKRVPLIDPTEALFHTPQLHIDYQAADAKERERIKGVFNSAMERIA